MGTNLDDITLRDKVSSLTLEQRGDGIEFTLNTSDNKRIIFKLNDSNVSELYELLHNYMIDYIWDTK